MSQFISYAQNFEDVMLWRALKHIEHGFYVDVGANDPKYASVTQAFYEHGWHGINIEPMRSCYDKLCAERSEDINLPYAIGAQEETLTFYEIADTGLSTLMPELAESAKNSGRTVVETQVRVVPLSTVFEGNVHGPVHFLKIDAEGFEKAAVEGLDISRWRPWIILIEGTVPGPSAENPDSLPFLMISSGYSFCYFDGLNGFFIAAEHPELQEAFRIPPNIFDDFILFSEVRLANDLDTYQKILAHAQSEVNMYQQALAQSQAELEKLRNEYVNILYSRSYRITAPLRGIFSLMQKLRQRAGVVISNTRHRHS